MQTRYWAVGLAVAVAAGCAQTGNVPADAPGSAKTLMQWRTADKDKDDEKPDEKKGEAEDGEKKDKKDDAGKAGKPDKEPEKDELKTDRPDFTESSSTVGLGRVQLEAGYTYSRDHATGVSAHSYPEALLRIGLFADWFELRLGQNVAASRIRTAAVTDRTAGPEDFYAGVKLGLTEQKAWGPELALILFATVPTGDRAYTANRTLPGASFQYGWEVSDFLSVGGSSIATAAVEEDRHGYVELAQSVTVGYALTDKLGAYTEVFGFAPHGANSAATAPMYYANGGFTYKVTPNLQYDIRVGAGLNAAADDFFAGVGFAYRR